MGEILRKFMNLVCEIFALRRVRWLDIVLSILLALIVGTLATELVNYLVSLYPESVPEGLEVVNEVLRNADGYLLLSFLFSVCVFAPVVEEFIFRGMLWYPIERFISSNVALFATSILFACAHVDTLHIIAVFPLGVLFGILRKRTGSIWPAIIAHAANNTMASLTLIF
jgi:membrane protease YdiL (CAAX protease family)